MEYSIIIPVYNSQESLRELSERLMKTFEALSGDYELIFVDDFSKDSSWNTLEKLKGEFKDNIKLIRLAKNYGQHNAIFCGLRFAKGNYCITIDDDLQFAPEDSVQLLEKLKESSSDVVYGVVKGEHSKARTMGSKAWKFGSKKIDNGFGQGSSFRVITKPVVQKIITHPNSVIFLDEIIQWHTHHIEFTTVNHYPRKYGSSNYSKNVLWNFIYQLSFNYNTIPLKMVTFFGVVISVITFILGVIFIIRKLFFNVSVPGFTATIVTILFSTSLILIGIGILGSYLNSILTLLHSKPPFSIKEEKL